MKPSQPRSGTVRRVLLIAGLMVAGAARADTAAPFALSFGRLVDPSGPSLAGPVEAPVAMPDDAVRQAATECLAMAIAYEAGHEPAAGQAAVAQVILNRVRHPAFPKSVCGVVQQGRERRTGCQFSFMCDGSLKRRLNDRLWVRARRVAGAVLDGARDPVVGLSTHYHADYVSPYWAPALVRMAAIGAHIFYRFPGRATAAAAAAATPAPAVPAAAFAPWGLAIVPVPGTPPM